MLSGLSADQTCACWKARRYPVAADWSYIQAFQMTVLEIIIASALLWNARHVGLYCTLHLYRWGMLTLDVHSCSISLPRLPPTGSVDKRCVQWPGGGGVYIKFIMLLSRNSTESAFFSWNRAKPTTYKILRTITTLHDTLTKSQQTYRSSKCRSSWSQSALFSTSIWESIAETSVSRLFIGAVIEGNLSRHTALISCHRFVDDPGDEENSASWACDELSRHRRAIHKQKGQNITKNSSILSSGITRISNSSPPSPFHTFSTYPSPYP